MASSSSTTATGPQSPSAVAADLTSAHPNPAPTHAAHPATARMPRLLYGTAWKKERTADLVYLALRSGFRGVDTACQKRHYEEALVGEGIRRALADGTVSSREELFVQTKFSPPEAQDPETAPYEMDDDVETQVRKSVAVSLRHLAADLPDANTATGDAQKQQPYLDCVLLHSPLATPEKTHRAYAALCEFHPRFIRRLGISNATVGDVATLTAFARKNGLPAPSVVQNRFYGRTSFDVRLRKWCRENPPPPTPAKDDGSSGATASKGGTSTGTSTSTAGPTVYQSFWTLTGNRSLATRSFPPVARLADAAGVDPEVAWYSLVLGLGNVSVLDGTTSEAHMHADLEGVAAVEAFAASSEEGRGIWYECLGAFRRAIGEA